MNEGEVWVYVPVYVPMEYEEPEESEIPHYASLYLVTRITRSTVFLLDLRNGQEIMYYDIQEDDSAYGWRRMRSDGGP